MIEVRYFFDIVGGIIQYNFHEKHRKQATSLNSNIVLSEGQIGADSKIFLRNFLEPSLSHLTIWINCFRLHLLQLFCIFDAKCDQFVLVQVWQSFIIVGASGLGTLLGDDLALWVFFLPGSTSSGICLSKKIDLSNFLSCFLLAIAISRLIVLVRHLDQNCFRSWQSIGIGTCWDRSTFLTFSTRWMPQSTEFVCPLHVSKCYFV